MSFTHDLAVDLSQWSWPSFALNDHTVEMTMTEQVDDELSRSRMIAGAVIFVGGQLAPLTIPLVASSALSTTWKSALSGLLLLGVPEIAILLAIVVLGKAGFNALKARLFGSLKDKLFPEFVSRRRYYLGLFLFLIPVLVGWLSPYLYEGVPDLIRYRLTVAIVGDVLLVVGLCLMGGQFWDKLRALFVYDAKVSFSSATGEVTSSRQ